MLIFGCSPLDDEIYFFSTYISLLLAMASKDLRRERKYMVLIFALLLLSFVDILFCGVMVGIVLSNIYVEMNEDYHKLSSINSNVIGLICLVIMIITRYFLPGKSEFVNTISALFFILSVYFIGILRNIFECNFIQYLGKISFGIYLCHWPILCSLTSFLSVQTYEKESANSVFLTLVPTIIVVILISHFFEKLIEAKLCKYIIGKIMSFIYKTK